MEYSFKKINKAQSIDKMKDDTISNINTINKLLEEVEKLKLGYFESNTEETTKIIKEENITTENIDESNSLNEEINYYYSRIKDLNITKNDESLKKIIKELPSKKNSNYQNIILVIIVFLIKEINEIKNLIESEKNTTPKEELEDFKKDILDIQNKINTIIYISNTNTLEDKNTSETELSLNNIVFLETETGNIYALNDINNNSVSNEYYEGFYELISSIEDGTFKNVKYLTSGNNKTARISEVKSFKRRVIFDRVGYDTYVIIGIFIKKSDKDKSYLEPLKNRIAIYRRNKDNIVKKIKNEENYLESQKEILNQIYKLLKPNTKKRG